MKIIWFMIGASALVLGCIGIVLPLLPTTPFVIVAAFAFGKSSPKLQTWLERNSVFGPIIRDWRQHGAIAPRYKRMALAMMAATFGLSVFLALPNMVLSVQAVCLSAAALFIWTRPSE